eukprot:g8133.t1
MAAIAERIKELEAELASLKVQGAATADSNKPAARRDQDRLFAGKEHTMTATGKIGGAFTTTADPAFLAERAAVYDKVNEAYQARLAAKPKNPIKITMPDGGVKEGISWETTPMDIAKAISNSLAKKCTVAEVAYTGERYATEVICKVEMDDDMDEMLGDQEVKGELYDLTRPLEGDCTLRLLTFDDELGKMVFWHSSAHVLGQGIERTFGGHLTIGPPIKGGFYYDTYVGDDVCTEDKWYPALDKAIKKIVSEKQQFQRLVVTKEEAMEMFGHNAFKREIIRTKVPEGTRTTVYRNGTFVDLCLGPHIPNTSMIKAMKVHKHSATYWMGDSDADSLQRLYAVSFPDNKRLKKWAADMELRKQNDHRRLGTSQELFFFHDLSPGSCFFMPHGARVYNKLIDFIKAEYWKRSYQEVVTPNIFSTDLWKISGHYEHYRDDMFLFQTSDNDEFAMKPMNCPGHCLMFRHRARSYRELPLRVADFGVLHRNELSGALSGLTRVRRFQQDDAHIFCRPDQVMDEVVGALDFMKAVYGIFNMRFKLERSTRPKKAVGADTEAGRKRWDDAEAALAAALDKFAGPGQWRDNPGDGAFYGPKIDIKVYDCMDRIHQCATVQLDFQLPIRFNLQYRSSDAKDTSAKADGDAAKDKADQKKTRIYKDMPNNRAEPDSGYERPVMVHRAMLGSVERMFAILTEHFGGKWPLWLSPRQAIVIPVHESLNDFAASVQQRLKNKGLFADIDVSGNTLKKMIRSAQVAQYNYIMVVGQDEMKNDTLSFRKRDEEEEKRGTKIDDVIAMMQEEIDSKRWTPPAPKPKWGTAKKGNEGKGKGGKQKGGKGSAESAVEGTLFSKVDIRVGKIVKVWNHPDSDKLFCEEIDVGEDAPRQIASGLREHYSLEQMQDRMILTVCNLKPAKLAGFKSCGMVLCAKKDGAVEFVDPPAGSKPGDKVTVEGPVGPVATPPAMKKKKIFDKVAVDLKTNDDKVACWSGKPLTVGELGVCSAPGIVGGMIM